MASLFSSQSALVRSQSGPLASVPFTSFPTCRVTRMESELFRVLLLRRLRMPLPLSVRSCCVAVVLICLGTTGQHAAGQGFSAGEDLLSKALWNRSAREAGARVSTNVMITDLDIAGSNTDARRLEVVAEGLSIFGGVLDGVALQLARRRKEVRFPELSGSHGRARLVVIAGEVGGRWSRETQAFLQSLAHCKAQGAPRILRASAEVAWYRRWCSLLVCSAAKAVAVSLLEAEQPRCGGPVAFGAGGVGRRAA